MGQSPGRWVLACVLGAAAARGIGQQPATGDAKIRNGVYTEYFPNGKVKRQARFKEGRLDGLCLEYTEAGKKRLTAEYRAGLLHGTVTRFEKGKPILEQRFHEGRPVYARSLEQLRKELARLTTVPPLGPDQAVAEREAGLRRLKAYRYLAGVPYVNLVLNERMNVAARAASRICERLGRMDHAPPNPGLPEAEYRAAYRGASSSNLAVGFDTPADAVDGWLNDSDARNLAHLGHRRWCLNPWLREVGFGNSGRFQAMWAFDASQKEVPPFDFISYPARGLMPIAFFQPTYAWSIVLDPRKYLPPDRRARPRIFRVDQYLNKVGAALKLNARTVDTRAYGVPNCIIFRPEKNAVAAGRRYLVEVRGLRLKAGNRPAAVRYIVEFVDLR
jgi:hypothetical protein